MATQMLSEPLSPTLHCYTGSMQRIFQIGGLEISEDLLLGLGAGVGFVYWHSRGSDPFLGGRANVGRPGEEGLECTACNRLGVIARVSQGGKSIQAERTLISNLQAGIPVIIQVDMGYLPYFRHLGDFHFGGHMIAAVGLDTGQEIVIVADREEKLYPVPFSDLRLARGSKCPGMKPNHRAITFAFDQYHSPYPIDVVRSIQTVCHGMLNPPITNLGCAGIRKAAQRVLTWEDTFTVEQLKRAVFNLWVFIDATGGTGGGLFRYMYGRYLQEAAEITGITGLQSCGTELFDIGDKWQKIAILAKYMHLQETMTFDLDRISRELREIADAEENLWQRITKLIINF